MASLLSSLASGTPDLDDHLRLIQNVDWAATSVGSMETWSQELVLLFHLIALDPQPRLLLLGNDNVMLYNQPYAILVGARHPGALGTPIREAFPDTYQVTESVLDEVTSTRRAAIEKHYCMPIIRQGRTQECHMSWIVVPFPSSSSLTGYSVMIRDDSEKRIAERRYVTGQGLTKSCAAAADLPSLWRSTIKTLSDRGHDCPFGILYALESDPVEGEEENLDYCLQGSLGSFGDLSITPKVINLDRNPLGHVLRQAMDSEEPTLLQAKDQNLPEAWANAACERGYGDPCSAAAIIPMRSQRYQVCQGFLIIGLSTRVSYDESYRSWFLEIGRTFDSCLTSMMISQERIKRREAAVKELAIREREVTRLSSHHQRLIKVLELSEVGVFECDLQGNLLQANSAWYNLSGYPLDAPKSAFKWLDYVHEKDAELVMTNWHSMLKGEPKSYEMRWKSTTSSEGRWILAVCLPVVDDEGRVISISGCTSDIDAQKRVEYDAIQRAEALERASASEQRFLRFTASSPVAVHIVELPSMTISYCNDTWFEMTGHPKVPYHQIEWGNVFLELDLPLIRKDCEEIVRTRESRLTQFRLRKMWIGGDGHRYQCWGSASSHPEVDENNQVKAIMTTTTDISHLKWAEEVQKSRVEEALEAKKQQENFIDMTSHEIRNPLGAVVVCADAVSENLTEMQSIVEKINPNEQGRKRLDELIASSADAIDTISSCSAHQKRIVDDLLTLSKLDSNLLQINPFPTRTTSIMDDMQRVFEVEANRAGIDLQTQMHPSTQELQVDSVMLDRGRIHQILINLVTNALKFTKDQKVRSVVITMGASKQKPSEGVLPEAIDFVTTRTMNEVVRENYGPNAATPDAFFLWFSVKDTGRGINAEEKKRLFSRFSQGSPRTYSKYGGSGLGLFISRELAELQGGEIGVASTSGVGSTFAFFVKTHLTSSEAHNKLKLQPELKLVSRPRRGSERAGFETNPGQVHVLVVEDNQVNQRVLKKQLTQKGYQVYTADNGQEALEFLRTTQFWRRNQAASRSGAPTNGSTEAALIPLHVVLMDIEMPIMDGITAVKNIRTLQKEGHIQSHVPIMAVSANARPEQTSMALSAGMDDSIAKPFRIVDLLPKIERLADFAYAN